MVLLMWVFVVLLNNALKYGIEIQPGQSPQYVPHRKNAACLKLAVGNLKLLEFPDVISFGNIKNALRSGSNL